MLDIELAVPLILGAIFFVAAMGLLSIFQVFWKWFWGGHDE